MRCLLIEARSRAFPLERKHWTRLKSLLVVQVAQTERSTSEVSCVIDQDDQGVLKATPKVHADETHPSDYTFANMAVQTDHCATTPEIFLTSSSKLLVAIFGSPTWSCQRGYECAFDAWSAKTPTPRGSHCCDDGTATARANPA